MNFLNLLNKEELNKQEYDCLVSDFFQKEEGLSLIKNNEELFWTLLRKHVIPKCKERKRYEFSCFKFPSIIPSINTFWESNKIGNRVFEFPVSFNNCSFNGQITFGCIFQEDVSYVHATFQEDVNFQGTRFMKMVDFMDTKFLGFSNFQETNFNSNVSFNRTQFNGVSFRYTYFPKNKLVNFHNIDFRSDRNVLYENCYGFGCFFSGLNFPATITFVRMNFTKSKFYNCDLSKVKFLNCEWPGYTRLKLSGESTFFKIRHGGYENTYRELKNNFESNKEWDLARMAFRSEMYFKLLKKGHELLKLPYKINRNAKSGSIKYKVLITRNKIRNWIKKSKIFLFFNSLIRYFKSKTANLFRLVSRIINFIIQRGILFFEVLILLFYSVFSGQTYSITRPIIWFAVFTVILFPYIYSGYSFEIFLDESCLRESVQTAFPFSKFDDNSSFFYTKLLQKILSVILITFFVIALRRRFKN